MNPTDPTTIGLRVPKCIAASCRKLALLPPLAPICQVRPLQTMAEITAQPDVLTLPPTELAALNPGVAFLPQLLNGRVVVGKFCQGAVKLEF